MKYTATLKIPTTVFVEVEADDGGEAEEKIRKGDYTCPDFNDQVLENLEEYNADIDIEEADTPA